MSRTIALVSAFPPGKQSLNEYGLYLAKGLAERSDIDRVVVIADKMEAATPELDLGPKVEVRRVWKFNSAAAGLHILRALRKSGAQSVLWNVQTASFGDREVPAALGLMAPAAARMMGLNSGVIAHNIIAGIDLENTQLKGQFLRQKLVRLGGAIVTKALTSASYTTVTLGSYYKHLRATCPNAEVHMVPHGTFDTTVTETAPLAARPMRLVTMGKFGTYKRLETLLEAFTILRKSPLFKDAELVIGGSDHPSTPGYVQAVLDQYKDTSGVIYHGYIAEEDIPDFFGQARLSIFDYSSTTGSSGVLHQAASYGSVPVFPRIGDFVDLCHDEGLQGAHYAPLNASELAEAMAQMLVRNHEAQAIADSNLKAVQDMPFEKVVAFHAERLFNGDSAVSELQAACA